MSNIDLETLRTEYEAARAELDVQPRAAQIAERAVVAAQSAFVDADDGGRSGWLPQQTFQRRMLN